MSFCSPGGRFSLNPHGNISSLSTRCQGGFVNLEKGTELGEQELPEHPHLGSHLHGDGLTRMLTSLPVLPVLPVPHPGTTLHLTPHGPCPPQEFLPRQGFSLTPQNPTHILGNGLAAASPLPNPSPRGTSHPKGVLQLPTVLLGPQRDPFPSPEDAPAPHSSSGTPKGSFPFPRGCSSSSGVFPAPHILLAPQRDAFPPSGMLQLPPVILTSQKDPFPSPADAPAPHRCFQVPKVLLAPQRDPFPSPGDAPAPHSCSWHTRGCIPAPPPGRSGPSMGFSPPGCSWRDALAPTRMLCHGGAAPSLPGDALPPKGHFRPAGCPSPVRGPG